MNIKGEARTSLKPETGAQNHHLCNSWTIVSRETGKAVLETWQPSVVAKVNTDKYEVLTTYDWLVRVNQFLAQVFKVRP
jgi:hypothetical protein